MRQQYEIFPVATGDVCHKNTGDSIFIGDDYTFIGGDCTFIGDDYTFIGDEYSLGSVACTLPAPRLRLTDTTPAPYQHHACTSS